MNGNVTLSPDNSTHQLEPHMQQLSFQSRKAQGEGGGDSVRISSTTKGGTK